MTQEQHGVSRRGLIKAAGATGGLAAISAVGLSGPVSADGFRQISPDRPLEGIRLTLQDALPNTKSQYLVIGHLQDRDRTPVPSSSFLLQLNREIDANGVETIADPNGLYAEIENSEGAQFIELCYVVYYSILDEVNVEDGSGRTFLTEKSYNTQGMVPLTIDLSQPRPDDNFFELKYTNDENAPGGGGTSPHP